MYYDQLSASSLVTARLLSEPRSSCAALSNDERQWCRCCRGLCGRNTGLDQTAEPLPCIPRECIRWAWCVLKRMVTRSSASTGCWQSLSHMPTGSPDTRIVAATRGAQWLGASRYGDHPCLARIYGSAGGADPWDFIRALNAYDRWSHCRDPVPERRPTWALAATERYYQVNDKNSRRNCGPSYAQVVDQLGIGQDCPGHESGKFLSARALHRYVYTHRGIHAMDSWVRPSRRAVLVRRAMDLYWRYSSLLGPAHVPCTKNAVGRDHGKSSQDDWCVRYH